MSTSPLVTKGLGSFTNYHLITRGLVGGDFINVTADTHHVLFDNSAGWYPLDRLSAEADGTNITIKDSITGYTYIQNRVWSDFEDGAGSKLGSDAATTVTALQALFDSP